MNITGNIAAHIPDRVDLHDGWEGCIYRTWDFPPEVIEAWDALSLGHGDMSIFVCYGWFEAWWRAFGGEHALFLAVLKRYGAIKAVFPCCVKDSPGDGAMGRSVSSLTNSHSCFYDFVIEPGVRREALANFCELVRRWNPCTQIYLDYMPRNSDNLRTLISILSRRMIPFHHYSQPWAPWSGKPGDWSAFRSSLPGRLRNTLKRNRRKAGALGQFHFEVVERSERLDEVLDVVFDIEYHSWKGRDGTAIKCLAEVEAFYRRLAHWSADRDSLILFLLKLDGIAHNKHFLIG